RVLEAVAERAGGPVDLLGHPLGGGVAVRGAAKRPDLPGGLLLFAPAGLSAPPGPPVAGVGFRAPPLLSPSPPGRPPPSPAPAFRPLRRGAALPRAETPTARRLLLWGAPDDAGSLTADEARKMLSASSGAHDLRGAARAALTADLTPDLARIDVPVGLLWGARDPLIPKPVAERIAAIRPEAPREAIPGPGHVAQIERPLP